MNVPVLYDRPAPGDPPRVLLAGDPDDVVRAPSGGEPMLVLRDPAQVGDCLRHPKVIMADTGRRGCPLTGAEVQDRDGGLLAMNPPALKQIRASLAGLFSADAAESAPAAEAVAGDLASLLNLNQEADLRAAYAEPFCARMVCRALGLPLREWRYIHRASMAAFGVVRPGAVDETRRAWDSLYLYYQPLVEAALQSLSDTPRLADDHDAASGGLIGLISGAMRRAGYDTRTIVRTLATVSNGFPAVFPVLTRCLTELLTEPAGGPGPGHTLGTVTLCLREELDWGEAVDALMRIKALFPFALPRRTTQDVTIGGRAIPSGTVLLPSLVAAGRAGAPPSIAFGAGPHYCPGAAYTRLWVTAAVRVFFEHFPHARLAGYLERLDWDDGTLPSPRTLPVVLRLARSHSVPLAWAIAAASVAALAYLPLIAGIVRGTVQAERLSWVIWAAEYSLLFAVQAARGGGPLLYLIGAGTAGCLIAFALTLWRGHGGLSPARLAVLAGSLATLAAWRQTRNPDVAFALLIAVEAAATVPTVLNAYRHGTESASYWLLIALAAMLEVPALALGRAPAPPLSYAFTAAAAAGAAAILTATAISRSVSPRPPGSIRDLDDLGGGLPAPSAIDREHGNHGVSLG